MLSELTKPVANAGLCSWLTDIDAGVTYISAVTIGELRYGIALLPDSTKRRELERWLVSDVLPDFSERVLAFDVETADRWGTIRAAARSRGDSAPSVDAMIAAIASQHNLTIVTRNAAHFQALGTPVLNPWIG